MTLSDLRALVYERLNYASSPGTPVQTRVTNMLNAAQRRILREPGLSRLRDTDAALTFASVSGQAIYGLPAAISRIRAITDRTNDRQLISIDVQTLRLSDPGVDASGTSDYYVPLGYKPTLLPPNASGLWAASSSAADTTQVLQLNGIRSGGLESGDVPTTLTGITRVALGTFTDYVSVTSLTLDAVAAGLVTVYDAAVSGNTIAQIAIGKKSPQYFCVQLYPTPTTAITYYVDGTLKTPDMDDADDVPTLPEEFHDLVFYGALVEEYEKADDPRLASALRLYDLGLSRLKHAVGAFPDQQLHMGARLSRVSRLGPWYPQ